MDQGKVTLLPYAERRGGRSTWSSLVGALEIALRAHNPEQEAAAIRALKTYHETQSYGDSHKVEELVTRDRQDAEKYLLMQRLKTALRSKNDGDEIESIRLLAEFHGRKNPELTGPETTAAAMDDRSAVEQELITEALNPPGGMTADWAQRTLASFTPLHSAGNTLTH